MKKDFNIRFVIVFVILTKIDAYKVDDGMSSFVVMPFILRTFASENNPWKGGWENKGKLKEAEIICSFVRACNLENCGMIIFRRTLVVAGIHNSTHNNIPTAKKLNPLLIISVTIPEKLLFVRRAIKDFRFSYID